MSDKLRVFPQRCFSLQFLIVSYLSYSYRKALRNVPVALFQFNSIFYDLEMLANTDLWSLNACLFPSLC